MDRDQITHQLTTVFRDTFENATLELSDDLTASDVDNWDSLTHMVLIGNIEKHFGIKFKLKDLNKMNTVGDLISTVGQKTA